MKKTIIFFIVLFLIILYILIFRCNYDNTNIRFLWSDIKIGRYYCVEEFLDTIENGSLEEIKGLFAPNALSEVDNIDKAILDLLEYYQGTNDDFIMYGPITKVEKEDGHIRKTLDGSYDVSTDKGDYKVAIRYVHMDTENPDNVGIWYVYIIRAKDDPNSEYAYWGDGNDTTGINIGLTWQDRQPKE